MEIKLESLRDIVRIQTQTGNYDYSEYMYGMANGMILALACMEGKEPIYLEKPVKWLKEESN